MKKWAVKFMVVVLASTCCLNSLAVKAAEPCTPAEKSQAENTDAARTATPEVRAEVYKEALRLQEERIEQRLDDFKWLIGIVVGMCGVGVAIIGMFAGFAALSRKREYAGHVRTAEQAARDARVWEQEAREKLASINDEVKATLNKIRDEGRAQIEELTKQAEGQRRISMLWSDGMRANKDDEFESAAKRFRQITEEPDLKDKGAFARAYHNWGVALAGWARKKQGEEADELFAQACEKYQKAVELKEDLYRAHNSWGGALLFMARAKTGTKQTELWAAAEEKCLKAESIRPGSGSYNLACIWALRGNKVECKKRLKASEQARELPTRKHAMEDEDLKNVWEEPWFKSLRFSGE